MKTVQSSNTTSATVVTTPPWRNRLSIGLLAIAAASAMTLTGCGGDGGGNNGGNPSPQPTPAPPDPQPGPGPAPEKVPMSLSGSLEFGQTSVTGQSESRVAPRIAPNRGTLLLFTPASPVDNKLRVFVEASQNGVSMGRHYLKVPSALPGMAEDRVAKARLPRYSETAWSGQLPTGWMHEGVQLTIGYDDLRRDENRVYTYRMNTGMPAFSAPSAYTVTRTKVLLWEDAYSNADTLDADRLANELQARLPVSSLALVDYFPARWNYLVAMVNNKRSVFGSYQDFAQAGGNSAAMADTVEDVSLAVEKANTGRGYQTEPTMGPTRDFAPSPLAYGSHLGQGRYSNAGGVLVDAMNGNTLAGAGWSMMKWGSECSQQTNAALGSSLGLPDMSTNVSLDYGPGYPNGAVWSDSHPQPFDTVRNVFRTWYKVDANFDPATSARNGRLDPMRNGGEPSDSQSCFSPFTNYAANLMQQRMEGTPTLRTVNGKADYYVWNEGTRAYAPLDMIHPGSVATALLAPDRTNVPVATIIGTIGSDADTGVTQLYPPMYSASGNTFKLPEHGHLDSFTTPFFTAMQGSYLAAAVKYVNGQTRTFIIPAAPGVADSPLRYFAFNVALTDGPTQVSLYRLTSAYLNLYTNLDLSQQTLLSTQAINVPDSLAAVQTRGGNALQESRTATVSRLCTQQTCENETADIVWHPDDDSQLYFVSADAAFAPAGAISSEAKGEPMRFNVPMTGADGNTYNVVFRATRTVNTAAEGHRISPANYWTAPDQLKDKLERLDVWAHANDNAALPAGRYTMAGAVKLLDVRAVNGAGERNVDRVLLDAAFDKP